jgi:flagellar protein FliO/FliZ
MDGAVKIVFAFVAVLALIGLAAWLVRRFAGNRIGANPNRGRMPRLAVIDAAAVDGRRRLVLVRRDNIEHLLMIGGPSDIVVESNIVRATAARDQIPQRPAVAGAEPPQRIAPIPELAWSDTEARSDGFDPSEPQMPEPPPRPTRSPFAEELRRPVLSERRGDSSRADPLAGFAPEPLSGRPEPLSGARPEPRSDRRIEPTPLRAASRTEPLMPRVPRPAEAAKSAPAERPSPSAERPSPSTTERVAVPPPPPTTSADQNLAEMAQRLEAALRRPAGEANEPRVGAPSVAPDTPAGRPARNEPAMNPSVTPVKSSFENLEDEMASLLGRPKNSS